MDSFVCHHEQHRQQLDPTEIVLVPVPLERLLLCTMAIVFVVILTASQPFAKFTTLCIWSMINAGVMILCGASHKENLVHTFLASVYATSLIIWDLIGEDTKAASSPASSSKKAEKKHNHNHHHDGDFLWRISPPPSSFFLKEPAVVRSHTTLLVGIIFHIFRLYDRGWQIQRWPIPTIVGTTVGWTVGVLIQTVFPYFWKSGNGSGGIQEEQQQGNHHNQKSF